MSDTVFIRFLRTGETQPLPLVTATTQAREHWLAPHVGHATVACLCVDPPVPMTVAHRRIGTETWYLCPASKADKLRHAPICPNRVDEHAATSGTDAPTAISTEDGMLTVRGGFTRAWREASAADESPPAHEPREDAGHRPGRAGLALLLWALWSQAELNVWRPAFAGKRFYGVVRGKLLDAAHRIRLDNGRSQWTLAEDLRIPPPWSSTDEGIRAECRRCDAELRAALADRKVLFLAGELRVVRPADDGGLLLYLHHYRDGFHLPPGPAARIEKAVAARAGGLHGDPAARRFALMRIRARHRDPRPLCVDIAVQAVASSWIPVESDYERALCDRLVRDGRSFVKPLPQGNRSDWLTDRCARLGVVPDFVLIDRKPAVFLEVLGRMADPAYQARASAKIALYRRAGIRYWIWDPSTRPEPLALP